MANKTMPERIYACRDTVVDAWGGTVEEGWHTVPQFDEEAEYIRADLAAGDASEPLATGQWRWALHRCGRWDIGRVDDVDGLCLVIDGTDWYPEELAEIGPVVHPPANNAN